MELKEYIRIIKKQRKLFFFLWLFVVGAVLLWQASRPVRYDLSLAVNISRSGAQQTSDYQYDQYYRMQADDKFAETVSQWLRDPSVANEIFSQAAVPFSASSLRSLSKSFRTEKLSANYIHVAFSVDRKEAGEKIYQAIQKILNQRTENLNKNAQSPDWFSLVYEKPILIQAKTNWNIVLAAALGGGFLLAVMGVLIKHYWQEKECA